MFAWVKKWRKQRTINGIRRHMTWFGHDISEMTDEEIEVAALKFGEMVRKTGITAQQANDKLKLRHKYKIFCCGETAELCVDGELETLLPLETGHIHTIKNRKWCCEWIDKNIDGEPIANFRPAP